MIQVRDQLKRDLFYLLVEIKGNIRKARALRAGKMICFTFPVSPPGKVRNGLSIKTESKMLL